MLDPEIRVAVNPPSLVGLFPLNLDKPTALDKKADRERVEDGLARAGVEAPVEMHPGILRSLTRSLREHDFSITPVIGFTRDRRKLVSIDSGASYGVAVDVGTTNIVVSLFDMRSGRKLGLREHENPQISSGADVLSRVHLAMAGKRDELHELLVRGVNEAVHGVCAAHGIGCGDVHAAVIAGNTIMSHFLLGLPVGTIPVEPYIPVANRMDFIEPGEIGLDIHPGGVVYVFPNTGSYVGGDIVSGILSTGLHKKKNPSLLVDVGTNAEIVLGCEAWLMAGAGAAGPALEGGVSGIGMRAAEGAICGVVIEKRGEGGFEVRVKTIGDKRPVGLCGSGMIELIAELFRSGLIDARGKFTGVSDRIRELDGRKAFVVHDSGEGTLAMKDTDIENFLRSKAAMFASLHVMVKSVGLGFRGIEKVYVSGAFGSGIDPGKAASIGMIPDIPGERFTAVGNSSLKGAELLLLHRRLLQEIDRICAMITYREMNTDGEFMREFPGAMFIPHTDPEVLRG